NISQNYLNNFSFPPITQAYSLLSKGKSIYFLTQDNKLIKIKSIRKIPYSGKIYDVDVGNDIILVKKEGSKEAYWSGNSNPSKTRGIYFPNQKPSKLEGIIEPKIKKIQGKAKIFEPVEWTLKVRNYTIKYQTPAPQKIEKEIETGKRITIFSNASEHYRNVKAYTDLPELDYKPRIYRIVKGKRIDITFNPKFNVSYKDLNSNGKFDRVEWIVPMLSNDTYEIDLIILNVKSYPTVGGNWTVAFNTTGKADLTITASNGTSWNLNGNATDLQFLEIKCRNQTLNYSWVNNSVFIANYSCDQTNYEISKVLTSGKHVLKFQFGSIVKYAENQAEYEITNCSTLNESGATYYLTQDIINSTQSYCINISANDITLDCQGHLIDGDDAADYGIYIYRSSAQTTNITIKNCKVSDWDGVNIYLVYANGNTITNTTTFSSPDFGIELAGSDSNTLSNITSYSNGNAGIFLYYSDSNTINNSKIYGNSQYGIRVYSSGADGPNLIYNNYFNNTNNFYFGGTSYHNQWNVTKQEGNNIYNPNNPYIGGNFWAKPNGTGYSQTCNDTDKDGFCDEPYTLETDNVDYLPLSDEWRAIGLYNLNYPEYIDVDEGEAIIKINVKSNTLSNISSVWIEENSTGAFVNHSMTLESGDKKSGIWNYTLSFSNLGTIAFKIYANNTKGDVENTTLYYIHVQDISISVTTDKSLYNPGENITVSGKAILLPDNTNVSNTNVSIWLDNVFQLNCTTDSYGNYSCNITAPSESGMHTITVNLTIEQGISGENSTTFNVTWIYAIENYDENLNRREVFGEGKVRLRANITNKVTIDKVLFNLTDSDGNLKLENCQAEKVGSFEKWDVYECNYTIVSSDANGIWQVKVWVNDTEGNEDSDFDSLQVDTKAPRYSQIQINQTEPVSPGTIVKFSVFWNDTFEGFSSNLSHWIFSWTGEEGQCGVWVNKSAVAFGNVAEAWSNHSEIVHCTPSFKWKIYANDSVGYWNVTPEQEVITDNWPIVEKPRTYSESLVEKTSFEQNEKVVIRVNVTDPDGAEEIDKVLINITSANGNLVVESAEMVNISSITNGYVFEYNYTLTNLQSDEFGTWQIEVWANDTYSQSDSNSSSFEVVNTPPSLEGISYECEQDCGWGERWVYKVNLTEPNNNTVNVSFWYSNDGLTWVYKDSEVIICPPSGCYDIVINFSYDPGWQASDVGTRYFKFNASDGAGGTNETSQSVLVQKDDAIAIVIEGSDAIARRWGEEKTLFRIRINDTDRNVWVEAGVNCTFYFTKDGATYSVSLENQTDSFGYCSVYLKPDCSYSVGAQHWKGGITDQAYKPWNTTEQNFSVKGKLTINIESPSESEILYKTHVVNLNSSLVDDCSQAPTQSYSVTWYNETWSEIASGEDATWQIPADYEVGPELIRVNASGTYYDENISQVLVYIYGFANISEMLDNSTNDKPVQGEVVQVLCRVLDANSSKPIENYPVNFSVDGTQKEISLTNASGYAEFLWNTSEESLGYHTVKCEIRDNETLYYNASYPSSMERTFQVTKKPVIETIK
ncbi:MAG: hypothetical protein DRJ69_02840, partial [Thermoprotei archaeon]